MIYAHEKAAARLREAATAAGADGMTFGEVRAITRHAWAVGLLAATNHNESEAARIGHVHRNTLHAMEKGKP